MLSHRARAELLAERRVNGFVTRHNHQPGGAKIQPVHQCAAGEDRHQAIVYRVQVLGVFA